MRQLTPIVVLATAWGSRFGGINSFSSDFCRALARTLTHHRVVCVCQNATDQDRASAQSVGIDLRVIPPAQQSLFVNHLAASLIKQLNDSGIKDVPWWFGHDVFTGRLALECAKQSSKSKCAIFMHMSYDDYSFVKHSTKEAWTVAERCETQRDVLLGADVGIAVGPLLYERLSEVRETKPSVMVVPGLPEMAAHTATKKRLHVITFGRFESEELLTKQAPLAVAAYARAVRSGYDSHSEIMRDSNLTLIGVPPEIAETLRDLGEREASRLINLHLLEFIQDRNQLYKQLINSNLCLMLSWHEGFGLAAWEAIGAGVPLVVSRNSGVFRLLHHIGGPATGCVFAVDVRGRQDGKPNKNDVEAAKSAILSVASDIPRALDNAKKLRNLLWLQQGYTWDHTAQVLAEALDLPFSQSILDGRPWTGSIVIPPADVIEGLDIAAAQRTLRSAESYYTVGEYDEALRVLASLKRDTKGFRDLSIVLDAALLEAETFLRLNKYNEVRRLVRKVAAETSIRDDWARYIRARSVENTMFRDLGKYDEAVKLAQDLLSLAEEYKLVIDVEKAHRLLARSLALAGECDAAVAHGHKALRAAQQRQDGDDEAKAALALGEGYRHGLDQRNAIPWYAHSRDLAGRAGNVDCFLWAVLGLADSLFLVGEVSDLPRIIDGVEQYVARHAHPLESLHIRLHRLSVRLRAGECDGTDCETLLDDYSTMGIRWPVKYITDLKRGEFTHPKKL